MSLVDIKFRAEFEEFARQLPLNSALKFRYVMNSEGNQLRYEDTDTSSLYWEFVELQMTSSDLPTSALKAIREAVPSNSHYMLPVVKAFLTMFRSGRQRGYEDGHDQGKDVGFREGHKKGLKDAAPTTSAKIGYLV